ncbi:MAG: hypothetical protein IKJ35_04905 [Clostridia bacterium]|nr:hypothetical protein [Clostridia bacterium]
MLQTENDEMLPRETAETECEKIRKESKKAGRRLWIVLGCVLGALVVMLVAVGILDRVLRREEPIGVPDGTYEFCTTYPGNIMEYDAYLQLNRQVSYCDIPSGYGLTQSITEENRKEFDQKVLFLYDYLQTVIAGDAEKYNTYFNETFFEHNEKKTSFSPQMLYNMKITYSEFETADNGDKLMTYILEYMIFQNDGTFRKDVGSDGSRPQYVTLRVGTDGTILIEKIVTKYDQLS